MVHDLPLSCGFHATEEHAVLIRYVLPVGDTGSTKVRDQLPLPLPHPIDGGGVERQQDRLQSLHQAARGCRRSRRRLASLSSRRPQLAFGDADGPQAQRRGLRCGVADRLGPVLPRFHFLIPGHLEEDGCERLLGHDRGLLDFVQDFPHLRDPIVGLMSVERLDNEFGPVAATNGTAVVTLGRGSGLL